MADRDEARQKRDEARRRRRAQPAAGEQQSEDAAGESGASDSSLRGAAGVAAAGAAVGAALGAATALKGRNGHGGDEQAENDDGGEERPDAQAEAGPEPESEEPDAEADAEPEAEQPAPVERSVDGASPDETAEVVRRARAQLQALHGSEPESISSLQRTPDGWQVRFEVIELRRVPDSTDVLASYEVVLDADLNVLRYDRVRRYYRAQADHSEGA